MSHSCEAVDDATWHVRTIGQRRCSNLESAPAGSIHWHTAVPADPMLRVPQSHNSTVSAMADGAVSQWRAIKTHAQLAQGSHPHGNTPGLASSL